MSDLTERAIAAECFETPHWAIDAILAVEILTHSVVDPCCGDGRMAEAAKGKGYLVTAYDLHDWGYELGNCGAAYNFLARTVPFDHDLTVFMNPPFSTACEFVDKAFELGARKVVAFQRWAWRESQGRRAWWERNPPSRIYLCGDRATCWLKSVPQEKRKGRGSPTAHGWFVWERGHPPGPLTGTVWKSPRVTA
jgi:hypothetical protein